MHVFLRVMASIQTIFYIFVAAGISGSCAWFVIGSHREATRQMHFHKGEKPLLGGKPVKSDFEEMKGGSLEGIKTSSQVAIQELQWCKKFRLLAGYITAFQSFLESHRVVACYPE